jgi:putative OPT family oligopeptide transporter
MGARRLMLPSRLMRPLKNQSDPPEMTLRAVALGLFLALVFGAANAYLGMKAGQTIAATIPAAVIAIAVFRVLGGGILEQNIARTAASVGEALVAGAIFTIPAFMMVEIGGQHLWANLREHYWQSVLILLVGGLIGVLFIIVLRRPLCVESDLPFPESVACAEVVKSGEEGGDAPKYVFGAMGFAGLLQVLTSDKGLQIFKSYAEGFLAFPRSVVSHFDFDKKVIGDVVHGGGIYWSTPGFSPALIGIGYIIGPRVSAINASGGVLAWWVLIPLLLFFDPNLASRMGLAPNTSWDVMANSVWYNIVRPIAVGTMLVGACYTLFSMRSSIAQSIAGALGASKKATHEAQHQDRTDRDIPFQYLAAGVVVLMVAVTVIYYMFTGSWTSAIIAGAIMGLTGFLLSAVGGYLVGLVGSSNQPLSGLTLSALVISALVMLAIGAKGMSGVAAVLGVASVVACACSVSGSLIQDLKAGYLLGGTPWKMQVVEIAAVVVLSLFLMAPIVLLHEANLATGGIGGRALPAPQAGLMAQLAKGIVGGQMAWGLIGIGAAFGIALIMCGARSPMLIAVGMYLPFDTVSAIFVGGVIKWVLERITARRTAEERAKVEEKGTLLASGLIAGEAIMGIILAVTFLSGISSFTKLITGSDQFSFFPAWGGWLSILGFAAVAWALIKLPMGKREARG